MEVRHGNRWAALGGVAFVVVNAVTGAAGSEPPGADASVSETATFFSRHAAGIEAGLWLFGLGAIGLVWWFGALYQWMRSADRSSRLAATSLVGFALGAAMTFAASAVWCAAALAARDLGETARIVNVIGWELRAAASFGLAVHLLATNALAVRDRSLRRWLIWIGAGSAVAFVASGTATSVSAGGAGDLSGLVAVTLYSVWILGLSHRLWHWQVDGPPTMSSTDVGPIGRPLT